MKLPVLSTKITVLCDCTDEFVLHQGGLSLLELMDTCRNVHVTNFSPIASQQKMYNLFAELNKVDEQSVVVLGNMQEVMALCTILANSLTEVPVDDVPVINIKDVKVWEVFDNENILLSMPDGRVIESSYDKALRPIVSDYQMIQAKAFVKQNPEGEAETTQFVETEGAAEGLKKTVEEVLSERKEKAKKIKEKLSKNDGK